LCPEVKEDYPKLLKLNMPQAVTQRKSTQIMNKNLYKDVKV
jgi:hypothetical protein